MPTYEAQTVRVKGLAAFNKAVAQADDWAKAAIKQANWEAAQVVAQEARLLAPVSHTKYKSGGRLRASIRPAKLLTKAQVRAGGLKAVPYANPIHWGWFYDRDNFIYRNIKPNPFLVKALGYKREEIVEKYNRDMEKLMERVADFQKQKYRAE